MDWRWLRWWYCACSAIALVNSIPACWLLSPRLLACSQSLLFHIFLVFHPLPLCSFLTRTWLGCRSLAIIHLYFVFTQTPARIFLHPNTQNALPGWNPSTPDVGARPNPCLASLGQGGGGPLRGWMEGLYIFWTLHFLSSQLKFGPSCFAAVWPRDCRIALKEGGRQQKRCDFWPLLPRQAVHVFGQKC